MDSLWWAGGPLDLPPVFYFLATMCRSLHTEGVAGLRLLSQSPMKRSGAWSHSNRRVLRCESEVPTARGLLETTDSIRGWASGLDFQSLDFPRGNG